MDIKVWPCIHPEMRMGSREWLWDIGFMRQFLSKCSCELQGRIHPDMNHGMKVLYRQPCITCYSHWFQGTLTIPGPLFQVHPLNLLSTLTYTESKSSDCSSTIMNNFFAFWTNLHTETGFRQISMKKILLSKKLFSSYVRLSKQGIQQQLLCMFHSLLSFPCSEGEKAKQVFHQNKC